MQQMILYSGECVLLDDEDYYKVAKWKWQLSPTGYVARSTYHKAKRKRIYLHRIITNCPADKVVDHINKNKLDNRQCNLRICSQRENTVANNGWINAQIPYKGVTYMSSGGRKVLSKYRARIYTNKREINLGIYNSAIEAARAYDQAAKIMHGEYAKLNFP